LESIGAIKIEKYIGVFCKRGTVFAIKAYILQRASFLYLFHTYPGIQTMNLIDPYNNPEQISLTMINNEFPPIFGDYTSPCSIETTRSKNTTIMQVLPHAVLPIFHFS
jgi:hypothetical protein